MNDFLGADAGLGGLFLVSFLAATLLPGGSEAAFIAFIAVHVFMVFATGPVNQIRAMITGNYRIHDEAPHVTD